MVDDLEVMDSLESALESGECYTLSDAGPLGARTAVGYLGKFWREFSGPEQWEECISAIALNMEREQYWPEVIYVNDHGNVSLVDVISGDLMAPEDHVDLDGAGLGELA